MGGPAAEAHAHEPRGAPRERVLHRDPQAPDELQPRRADYTRNPPHFEPIEGGIAQSREVVLDLLDCSGFALGLSLFAACIFWSTGICPCCHVAGLFSAVAGFSLVFCLVHID